MADRVSKVVTSQIATPAVANSGGDQTAGDTNARVVAELRPEEVRWFYKKGSGDKLWHPMNGRDSLAMETTYRKHQALLKKRRYRGEVPSEERIHAHDWAKAAVALGDLYGLIYDTGEKAKTSTGDQGQRTDNRLVPKSKKHRFPYRLEPMYWEGNRMQLTRGTWFLEAGGGNWQPLDGNSPDLVELIEAQHMKMFANHPIGVTKPGPLAQVMCELKDAEEVRNPGHGAEVRWHSVDDVFLYNHSQSSKLWRVLRLSTLGARIMRGYRTEARMDDGPPPVTDLIFVIHGIGQKRTRTKIVKRAAGLREISDTLLRSHFADMTTRRPMFLPVDWRTELELSEQVIDDLTPDLLHHIRLMFNESLMDLLYYASPVHGRQILSVLSDIINRMYHTFVSHDRGFTARNGRVCLVAHSLGSVIAYDILSGGTIGVPSLNVPNDSQIPPVPQAEFDAWRFAFPVHHMFCLGSPLGIFLATKHARGKQVLQPPGAAPDFRLHNIYHPADAVAYRIEPLISDVYAKVRPLEIHKADSRDPKPYESLPNEPLILRRNSSPSRTNSMSADTPKQMMPDGTEMEPSGGSDPKNMQSPSADPKEKVETVDIPEIDALPYRVDVSLRRGRVINTYWTAITAHQSYWTNPDVVMYILTSLYGMPKSIPGKSPQKDSKK